MSKARNLAQLVSDGAPLQDGTIAVGDVTGLQNILDGKLPLSGGTLTGSISFAGTQTWPTFNQSTTGNAATATTLQTARTINGVSFDGSANITVADSTKLPLAGGTITGRVTRTTSAGINSPSARFALSTSQQAEYHISSSISGSSATNTQQYGITFSPSGGNTQAGILISENGSDGTAIGFFCTNSYASGPQLRGSIDPYGNFLAAGNVTAYSDERLKKDWVNLAPDFVEQLATVKHGTYTRTDLGTRQIGVSAQSLQGVVPEGVLDGEYLSVAYGNVALAAAVELAKRVVQLEAALDKLIGENK